MINPLRLVFGLFACLAFASAVPALFPREKITTYRYYAEVKSETINPTPYASQFVISGLIHVTPEISDPNLKNAFYVSLDVTHGVSNGKTDLSEKIAEDKLQPIPDAAKVLKDPFVAIFDDNGKVKGLIVNEKETGWSRNIKKSIASTLQLDLSSMLIQTPIGAQNFSSNESTVYGECTVDYNVKSEPEQGEKVFVVTKSTEPIKCTKFIQHKFNSEEPADCFAEKKGNLGTFSQKTFHIENNGEDLLIKKLVAYGVINYSPWKERSETHYVLANQTFDFESSVPVGSITLPTLNTKETVLLNDVTFEKSQSKYADKAAVDLSYGRHVIDTATLITDLIEILGEAVDYMDEDHWEMIAPDTKHGQTLNRILDTMSFMDTQSFEEVLNRIRNGRSWHKEVNIRKVFLRMLPYVGTEASSLFIVSIVRNNRVPELDDVATIAKLPFYVRAPTEELLVKMEGLLSLHEEDEKVQTAGILAFATLIHKAYRYQKYHHPLNPELVSRYVNQYFDHVINETSYKKKMIYIQAMRNIGTGDVFELLKPIVSGKVAVSEKPQYLRLIAMYAYEGASHSDVDIDGLFWPILENEESPLEIRAAALTILFKQPPKIERFMRLLVLMEHEKNEHLYNYYYTTMKTFAESSSSRLTPLKEMARSVLLDIRARRPASSDSLTTVKRVDYENHEFGFGESLTVNSVADESTGVPFYGKIEYSSTDGETPANQLTFFVRVEGLDGIAAAMPWHTLDNLLLPIEEIENLLKRASKDMPVKKPIHVEFSVMNHGHFVMSEYIDNESISFVNFLMIGLQMSLLQNVQKWQYITYDRIYTELVSNDLGLPTIFETKIPRLISAQIHVSEKPDTVNLELGTKYWSHGYQSMEVYNPIIDTWHAIRRVSAVDSSLPIAMTVHSPRNGGGLTVTLPRLPITQYSVTYRRSFYKNYVMVIGAKHDQLELYCPSCNLTEIVSKGEEHEQSSTTVEFTSGLTISTHQYGCDKDTEWDTGANVLAKIFDDDDDDDDDDDVGLSYYFINGLTILREYHLHSLTEAKVESCGYLTKIEPSHVNPTSEIDINIKLAALNIAPSKLSLPSEKELDFNVSVVVKAEPTKAPVRSLTVHGHWYATERYLQNDLRLDVTLSTAEEEEDVKICIDAYKTYPPTVSDPFDRAVNVDGKTTGQIRVVFGVTAAEACPTAGSSVRIEIEGKVSDEQKEALEHGKIHDACQRDVENPLYMYAESSVVPRTAACLREALLRTTLRKYSFDVFYQNISAGLLEEFSWADTILYFISSNNVTTLAEYTEPGNAKIHVEFPLKSHGIDLHIRTPTQDTKYTDILNGKADGWDDVLDNTYFTAAVLENIQKTNTKFCVVYPEILLNADGATTPYTVPGQWTLLTGDYWDHRFSVFVKSIEPKKLGLLITVTNHRIEIIPTDANPTVTVDGDAISYENDLVVPTYENGGDSLAYRITWSPNPKRFKIETTFSAFKLEWTERSVSLALSTALQGKVTGLCGHLDGEYKEGIAKVYTLED